MFVHRNCITGWELLTQWAVVWGLAIDNQINLKHCRLLYSVCVKIWEFRSDCSVWISASLFWIVIFWGLLSVGSEHFSRWPFYKELIAFGLCHSSSLKWQPQYNVPFFLHFPANGPTSALIPCVMNLLILELCFWSNWRWNSDTPGPSDQVGASTWKYR